MIPSATVTSHNRMIRTISDAYGSIDKTNKEILSEKKYESFSEISPQDLRILEDITNDIEMSDNRLQNNQLLSKRLTAYEDTVQSLQEVLNRGINFIQIVSSPTRDKSLPVAEISDQYLNEIKGNLEKTFEGRFLFSGSKTNTPPIGNIVQISNITDDETITASYYKGDNIKPAQQISYTQTLNYALTADNETFKKFFAAFHYAKKFETTGERVYIEKSNDLLQEVKQGLSSMLAVLGSYSDTVNKTIETETVSLESKKALKASMIDTDIPTATTALALKVAKLNAVFMVSAKTSDLFITNYIK